MEVPNINFGKILCGLPAPTNTVRKNEKLTIISGTSDKPTAEQTDATATTVETNVAPAVEKESATTVEKDIAPAVEHEKVTEEHEEKEQEVIEKERHQDHYHTTIQPATDREVLPTKHQYEDTETKIKHVEHDDGAVAAKAEDRNADFESTRTQGDTVETKTKEAAAVASEQVHHHLHETIQPVIEKETIQPTVTHKTVHIKEVHHDAAVDEGVTKMPAVPVEALKSELKKQ